MSYCIYRIVAILWFFLSSCAMCDDEATFQFLLDSPSTLAVQGSLDDPTRSKVERVDVKVVGKQKIQQYLAGLLRIELEKLPDAQAEELLDPDARHFALYYLRFELSYADGSVRIVDVLNNELVLVDNAAYKVRDADSFINAAWTLGSISSE